MRLYKATTWHKDDGNLVSWHAKKREAREAILDRAKSDDYIGPCFIETFYEVTVSVEGLLRFLNSNFTTDNG